MITSIRSGDNADLVNSRKTRMGEYKRLDGLRVTNPVTSRKLNRKILRLL